MKTERLYYSDCYLREFRADVVRVSESRNGFRVYLDRTAFYPESGGQPADFGQLGGVFVLNVVDEGEEIAHELSGKPASNSVEGSINWTRRFDHMQQHTGQHILSAAFESACGYRTVSFHMGDERSTIDLRTQLAGRKQLEAAEELANQVIFEDRPVRVVFKPSSEAAEMDLRKPTERQGEVRLVVIEGFDLSACGGTHVASTGAVGLILVRGLEQTKDMTRVEFVCGGRALRHARRDYLILGAAARELSAGFESVPTLIRKRAEEFRESLKIRERLSDRLTNYAAKELYDLAPVKEGRRVVRKVFTTDEGLDLRAFAHALTKFPKVVAILGMKRQPATICF